MNNFEEVVKAELPVLYRVARRWTLDPHEAEDLVGHCLMSAAKAWNSFDGAHPRSWLLKILKNTHLNSRMKPRLLNEPKEQTTLQDTFELVANRLAVEAVLQALDRLPDDFRIVVTLCDLEQIAPEEAATILDIPNGTVRSRLHRGRKILRNLLRAYEANESPRGSKNPQSSPLSIKQIA